MKTKEGGLKVVECQWLCATAARLSHGASSMLWSDAKQLTDLGRERRLAAEEEISPPCWRAGRHFTAEPFREKSNPTNHQSISEGATDHGSRPAPFHQSSLVYHQHGNTQVLFVANGSDKFGKSLRSSIVWIPLTSVDNWLSCYVKNVILRENSYHLRHCHGSRTGRVIAAKLSSPWETISHYHAYCHRMGSQKMHQLAKQATDCFE